MVFSGLEAIIHETRMHPRVRVLFAVFLFAVAFPAWARSPDELPYPPQEVILKFKPHTRPDREAQLLDEMGAVPIAELRGIGAQLHRLRRLRVEDAVARYRNDPDVEYVEPNYTLSIHLLPDDPLFPQQWALRNTGQTGGLPGADIHAVQAWDVPAESREVRLGIIDTGVDYTHPDLAPNIWRNPGEIPDNRVDDDGNGYVDDVRGWDFLEDDNDPMDDNGHGTHVAGIAAAAGNNGIGIAGVAWRVRIVPLKFLSASGRGSVADAVRAIEYATAMGIPITNNSWGGAVSSRALQDAVEAATRAGQIFVASAGNEGANNDAVPTYPASIDDPGIVAVAATTAGDALAAFSNFGTRSVDLGAPGVSILSTLPGGRYGTLSGTSMAAPYVSGALALVLARFPTIELQEARERVLAAVDTLAALAGRVATGGRLNAFFAIAEPDSVAPSAVVDLAVTDSGSDWVTLTWTAPGDDGPLGTAARYDLRYTTERLDESTFPGAVRATGIPRPRAGGSQESFRVTGLEFRTTYSFALRALDEFSTSSPLSNVTVGSTLGPPALAFFPEELRASLPTGSSTVLRFTIQNAGEGTLDFRMPLPEVVLRDPAAPALVLAKGAADPRLGPPVVHGSGGPDGGGYRWNDSTEPRGPVFSWIEIADSGTLAPVTGDDATAGPFPLGFVFPFYGTEVTEFHVCTNGWLSFASHTTDFVNQPLPNTGAPPALVAPFWDDLDVGEGAVFFRTDPSRLVVEWNNVRRLGSTERLTFEAILDGDGTITFQYQKVGDDGDQGTVGIQDATGRVGLTVAFNTSYIHDALAVRLQPLPQWLTVNPASGMIRAPGREEIMLHVDATGLAARRHQAWVRIDTNDPLRQGASLPVVLDVIGAPDIALPSDLDVGSAFLGASVSAPLIVENTGTDTLHVLPTVPPPFGIAPSGLAVPPRSRRALTVSFTPRLRRRVTRLIRLLSDDPDEPEVVVPVSGEGSDPPTLRASPDSLAGALVSGEALTREILLANTGAAPLRFTVDVDQGVRPPPHAGAVLAKGEEDSRLGFLGAGGPDAFGYRWVDSHDSRGPAFTWIDIQGAGRPVFSGSADEANAGPFPLGFAFPFYGETFTSIRVASDGFLSFTSPVTDYANDPLPSPDAPENLLAVFWDDLVVDPAAGSQVYVAHVDDRCVVQYENVKRFLEEEKPGYSFQVQLRGDGSILYLYRSLGPTRSSATIGIQNARRDDGLTLAFNRRYTEDSLAVRLSPVHWLALGPPSGTVPPGGNAGLSVHLDAAGLHAGTYRGAVIVHSDDPFRSRVDLPVRLLVSGTPDLVVDPDALEFGEVYVGFPAPRTVLLKNEGTDLLTLKELAVDGAGFALCCPAPDVPFVLTPGREAAFQVSASAREAGAASARLRIRSDDLESPETLVPLRALVVPPPVASVRPSTLASHLTAGGAETQEIVLQNQGGSPYRFTVRTKTDAVALRVAPRGTPHAKGEETSTVGLLGAGGPDAFGYTWTDSDDPQGPAFTWLDLAGRGVPVFPADADDDNAGPISLGFPFPFYGEVYESLHVCANGWVSFIDSGTEYSNVSLPNQGFETVPRALLAVLWDDLEIRAADGGTVRTASLGDRFVVRFEKLRRFRQVSGGLATFEVQLFPDGTILYQYARLGPETESATLGIQNAARDDGLTVVFNAPYLHENLAVRFLPHPSWLGVGPLTGLLPPGESLPLAVRLDALGLLGGTYRGLVELHGNDPARGVLQVPVTLAVQGIPALAVEPATLDFGEAYFGYPETLAVGVGNPGSAPLVVDRVASSSIEFSAHPGAFTLPPYGHREVNVVFRPSASSHRKSPAEDSGSGKKNPTPRRSATLAFQSNAPGPVASILATAQALPPPVLEPKPKDLSFVILPGGRDEARLTVRNRGDSDLRFTVDVLAAKGEGPSPGAQARGGPDGFGYLWTDSDAAGGPAFQWIDIVSTGASVFADTADDVSAGPFPIGFSFPFYGVAFDSVRICSNGFLSFTNPRAKFINEPLPTNFATTPENIVAAWWDDLVVLRGEGGAVYRQNVGGRLVVQFEALHRIFRGGGPYTFQVQLFPDGTILVLYRKLGWVTDSATIGIQNGTRDLGLTVVYNAPYVREGLAVRMSPPTPWLRVTPQSGVLRSGKHVRLAVICDTRDLPPGHRIGQIRLHSNDPAYPVTTVPVDLEIPGAAALLTPQADPERGLPLVTRLYPVSPNPFSDRGLIRFDLAQAAGARLSVFDVSGRRVRVLVEAPLGAGRHTAFWDGSDESGRRVASGLYLVRFQAGATESVQRVILVR